MKKTLGFTLAVLIAIAFHGVGAGADEISIDPGCEGYQAWTSQYNPRSDSLGKNNSAYPEANATYWTTVLTETLGTTVTVQGRYPLARYMSFQLYDDNRNVQDAINDLAINPDSGQNNPYRTGSAQGTYTVHVVFGNKPQTPAANTVYTQGLTNVALVYRIYYSNNPDNLAATNLDPVLPVVSVEGSTLTSCPPRPIIVPEDLTVWGRLDNSDFIGTRPSTAFVPSNPPTWNTVTTGGSTPYYPSEDNSYLIAAISRDYLLPPYNYDMVVVRFRAPTFANTQAGQPPYTPAQMRFWSFCQDEPILTSVVRCIPDNNHSSRGGFATFVISDPSRRPSDTILNRWGARWVPWGALQPGDVVYDIDDNPLTNDDGVFFGGLLLYRQTMADPSFRQSIENIAKLPPGRRKAAMGAYWPTSGYCTSADFQASGVDCIAP
jgi:hypothetical protein